MFIFSPLLFSALVILFAGAGEPDRKGPSTVEVRKEGHRYQLYRDGVPYFIKGAGGYQFFDRIRAYGGNSIRIWSTKGAKAVLDQAQSLGLTVTLGLDLAQVRTGFSYRDRKAVKAQLERIKKDVLEFKDHPALLMWGVGNEVEQFGEEYEVWDAMRDIVNYIHKVDPRHPTTTMLAGVPRKHIRELVKRCPQLDVLSLNLFKLLPTVAEDIAGAGWTGPFMLGEWGATGYWESEMVPWNTFVEETTTEKARLCAGRYDQGIVRNSDRCLGGYVFYWGWKQARTHTLLSLFSEDSLEYGLVDVMHRKWTGRDRKNRAPAVSSIRFDNQDARFSYLRPSTSHSCSVQASDPDNDRLVFRWEIYPESQDRKEGGDEEAKPQPVSGLMARNNNSSVVFKAPKLPGAYRIYVYVMDGRQHLASANFPFYVKT